MTTHRSHAATATAPAWHDPERVLDIDTAAAIVAIWAMVRVVRPPFIDTDLANTIYLAVVITAMLALAGRSPARPLRLPTTPPSIRRYVPLDNKRRPLEVAVLTAATVTLAQAARLTEDVVAIFTNPVVGGCGTYNDVDCTNNEALVDFVGTFNASVGEELIYRLALLTIVARFVGMKWAIAAQAVVWGIGHTWFDNGYSASTVAGIIAVGLVYAVATLATRSVWPAIVTHAFHNLSADINAHAPAFSWIYIAVFGAVLVAAIYLVVVAARTKESELRPAERDEPLV